MDGSSRQVDVQICTWSAMTWLAKASCRGTFCVSGLHPVQCLIFYMIFYFNLKVDARETPSTQSTPRG